MKRTMLIAATIAISLLFMADDGCDVSNTPVSASGVKQAGVNVPIGADGYTAEQRNVRQRLIEDNKPGSIKHLYVISPYSGQVILYSTVKGKVTSGGKRLTPTSVNGNGSDTQSAIPVEISGQTRYTTEVLEDDGTYGHSGDYLYWWDVRGAYHQHYLTGGQIITISDQPLPVKSVTINIENTTEK